MWRNEVEVIVQCDFVFQKINLFLRRSKTAHAPIVSIVELQLCEAPGFEKLTSTMTKQLICSNSNCSRGISVEVGQHSHPRMCANCSRKGDQRIVVSFLGCVFALSFVLSHYSLNN